MQWRPHRPRMSDGLAEKYLARSTRNCGNLSIGETMFGQKKVASVAPAPDAGDTAFSGAEYDAAYPDGYEDHFWHLARVNIILDALQRYVAGGAVVLEVGCGRGLYVAKAGEAGFFAVG